MFNLSRLPRLHAPLLLSAALVACNIETTPSAQSGHQREDQQTSSEAASLEEEFINTPYGIATSWYDYDSTTHAILPKPYIYRIKSGADDTLFRVISYYNARGDSGYFHIERHRVGHDASPVTIELDANIKEGPVCVNLKDAHQTDCVQSTHDLVLRVELRAVPGAGFAVSNPAIYTSGHFLDPEDTQIWYSDAGSFDAALTALDDPGAWTPKKDVKMDPSQGPLFATMASMRNEDASPAFLQATASMKLVGWSTRRQGPNEFSFSANCVKLATSQAEQALPLSADARSAPIAFDPGTVSLVSLCADDGPELVESSSSPYRARWPSADTYDLVVDTLGDSLQIRPTADHHIWSSGAAEITPDTVIPAMLWL